MVKLTPTDVKINTNLVWTSHNTGGVEFNTGVFAVYTMAYGLITVYNLRAGNCQKCKSTFLICPCHKIWILGVDGLYLSNYT